MLSMYVSVWFSCLVVSDSLLPHELQHTRPPLSITNSWNLLRLMSIELVMPSRHLILCHCPLLLLHSVFPSIRVFSTESVLHIRWPEFWSFGISPSNEYSGLIPFYKYHSVWKPLAMLWEQILWVYMCVFQNKQMFFDSYRFFFIWKVKGLSHTVM